MKPQGAATDWEFRWRFPILIASQPILAALVALMSEENRFWQTPSLATWSGSIAVAVATLSILLRVQATSTLHARVMAAHGPDTSRCVTHGIYRALRNPLYLSSLMLFGAYAVLFGWGWMVGFVAFHVWRYRRIVRLEEHSLRTEWAGEFDDYCRTVPRWIPRWSEFRREFGRCFFWQGVVGNSVYVGMWLGIVVAVAQQNRIWIDVFEVSGGVVMATYYLTRRARRTAILPEPVRLDSSANSNGRHSVLEVVPVPHIVSALSDASRTKSFGDKSRDSL